MSICSECKKEYQGYLIFLCKDVECFMMYEHTRDIYYDDTHGLCEPCRIKLETDDIWKVQNWFAVEVQIMLVISNIEKKEDKTHLKTYQDALKRVRKIIKKAEENPKVQAMYRENNPAAYMEIPKEKKLCVYCGENYGQTWINNPNADDWQKDLKENLCWWICLPCEKVIELQQQDAFLGHFEQHVRNDNPELAEKVRKDREKLQKDINDICHEDGTEGYSAEITKKDDGGYDVKEKHYG